MFLSALAGTISDEDLQDLAAGGGFVEPNNFDFRKVLNCLRYKEFPVADYFEFGWAINECGVEYLGAIGSSARIFASSIYLYCYRSMAFDGNYESAYCYLMLKTVLEKKDMHHADLLSGFLEWLHDFVVSGDEGESYWLLLTWIVLKVCTGCASGDQFEAVMKVMRERNFSKFDIDAINDCVFPREADWLALVDEWVGGSDFCLGNLVPLICGRDF